MNGVVLLAAGNSRRMGENKLLMDIGGKTPIEHALGVLAQCGELAVCAVVSGQTEGHVRDAADKLGLRCAFVRGGAERSDSVRAGLAALADAELVAIHDCARFLASPELFARCFESAAEHGSGVACLPLVDTLWKDGGGALIPGPEREGLLRAQTPQVFRWEWIAAAYEKGLNEGIEATDDAGYAMTIAPVHWVTGEADNIKLTTAQDALSMRQKVEAHALLVRGEMRVGYGEDAHALVPGRALVLGGVTIPHEKGLLGHSDADALCHALTDALMGACAAGDIGQWFPDTDSAYKDADSLGLLCKARERLGVSIVNADATVIAQRPRLAPYIPAMRANIAQALGVDVSRVSVKATTTERMGFEGREEGMSARAVVLVRR